MNQKWNLALILIESDNQTDSDSNEVKENTEASFECPMQRSYYFEPLYPDASKIRPGAYYCIMLFAYKFKLSDKAIHGLTMLLHVFCPSKQFSVPYKHDTVCTLPCQMQCNMCIVPEIARH